MGCAFGKVGVVEGKFPFGAKPWSQRVSSILGISQFPVRMPCKNASLVGGWIGAVACGLTTGPPLDTWLLPEAVLAVHDRMYSSNAICTFSYLYSLLDSAFELSPLWAGDPELADSPE